MGAHALKPILSEDLLNSYETAVKYQIYHALALILVGILYGFIPSKWLKRATLFFILGTILFSGSIYLLIVLKSTSDIGLGKLGLLTPIGGVMFIIGWVSLAISCMGSKKL